MNDRTPKYLGIGEARYKALRGILRNYEQYKADATELLHRGRNVDGMPRGGGISDTTASIAMQREHLMYYVRAVDKALVYIGPYMAKIIWENEKEGKTYTEIPETMYIDRGSIWEAKKVFYSELEKNLGWKV